MASDVVVSTLRSVVPESEVASAYCTVLAETLRSSASVAAQAGWAAVERRRTERILSARRQVQSGVVGVDTVISLRLYGQMSPDATPSVPVGSIGEMGCERHHSRWDPTQVRSQVIAYCSIGDEVSIAT